MAFSNAATTIVAYLFRILFGDGTTAADFTTQTIPFDAGRLTFHHQDTETDSYLLWTKQQADNDFIALAGPARSIDPSHASTLQLGSQSATGVYGYIQVGNGGIYASYETATGITTTLLGSYNHVTVGDILNLYTDQLQLNSQRAFLIRTGTGAPGGTGSAGEQYYDTTNKRRYESDGIGWVVMSEPSQTYTPTVTAGTGAFTSVTATGEYHRSDGFISVLQTITITTNGTAASYINALLPVAALAGSSPLPLGTGRENNTTGLLANVIHNGGLNTAIYNYNNTYPGGNGYSIVVSLRYRMTTRYS